MDEEALNGLINWMKIIILTAAIVLVSRQFLFEPVSVHGQSMMPTFEEDDKVVLSKISRIDNFDMIVFVAPDKKNYIKRVIGIPGDRVEMKDDQLYLNGKRVAEPYLEENRKWAKENGYPELTADFGEFIVPGDCYFVLGDNRLNSVDSRIIGFILEEAVIGEVKFRLSPVENIGIVK
ncbi:signal peptidase I [Planococcus sp. 1R117A]|uniref:signal peptidase I n=1 Tax=Planococcus sp. 1R117A TaxID=3447020 RepID=UPI003EDC578B